MCVHITNLLTHACVCDISCLVQSGVQCSVVLGLVLFSHHTSLWLCTGGTSYCTVGKSLSGQEDSVCDLSRALGPVLERGEPRSTSGHYQHIWVHSFLDLLWGIWAIHVAKRKLIVGRFDREGLRHLLKWRPSWLKRPTINFLFAKWIAQIPQRKFVAVAWASNTSSSLAWFTTSLTWFNHHWMQPSMLVPLCCQTLLGSSLPRLDWSTIRLLDPLRCRSLKPLITKTVCGVSGGSEGLAC